MTGNGKFSHCSEEMRITSIDSWWITCPTVGFVVLVYRRTPVRGGSIALAAHDPATDEIEQTAGVVIVAMIVIYMSLGVRLQVVYTGWKKICSWFQVSQNQEYQVDHTTGDIGRTMELAFGWVQSFGCPTWVTSDWLGGGNSNTFFFHPYLGKWSNLTIIIIKWVGSTTSLLTIAHGFALGRGDIHGSLAQHHILFHNLSREHEWFATHLKHRGQAKVGVTDKTWSQAMPFL